MIDHRCRSLMTLERLQTFSCSKQTEFLCRTNWIGMILLFGSIPFSNHTVFSNGNDIFPTEEVANLGKDFLHEHVCVYIFCLEYLKAQNGIHGVAFSTFVESDVVTCIPLEWQYNIGVKLFVSGREKHLPFCATVEMWSDEFYRNCVHVSDRKEGQFVLGTSFLNR